MQEQGQTPAEEGASADPRAGVLRGAAGRYGPRLDNTLRSAVVPYGYTVTISASGA